MNSNQKVYQEILAKTLACQEAIDFVVEGLSTKTPKEVYDSITRPSWLFFLYEDISDFDAYWGTDEQDTINLINDFVNGYCTFLETVSEPNTLCQKIGNRYQRAVQKATNKFYREIESLREKRDELLAWLPLDSDAPLRQELAQDYYYLFIKQQKIRDAAQRDATERWTKKTDQMLLDDNFLIDHPKCVWEYVERCLLATYGGT